MIGLVVFIHVIISLLLMTVILMQSSKGGGLAGAFGGGGGVGSMFGGRGVATFLSKVTTVLAVLFMLSSVGQVMIRKTTTGPKSVIQEEVNKSAGTSPAAKLPGLPGQLQTQQSQTPVQKDTTKK
jgi:preprotein translocase subunit SecG